MAVHDGDDYVTCEECGHPLERHGLDGCDYRADGCPCTERWTRAGVQRLRRAAGLPARFDRRNY